MSIWTQGGIETLSSSTSMVDAAKPADSTPKGPSIDVFFNLSGGRCRTYPQCPPPGGPPSTSSSISVVDAARPAGSTPQGVRHQCHLQHQWWTLPDPPEAPPRGPAIDVFFNLNGGCCWTRRQCPQGAGHRRLLQPRWWTLSGP
jgi:hypothetical protein